MKFTIICGCIFAICIAGVLAESTIDWKNVKQIHLIGESPKEFKKLRIPTARIIGGEDANTIEHFPYQCRLLSTYEYGTGVCGCSVISNEYVITAAHCLKDVKSTVVYLGTTNTAIEKVGQQKQDVDSSFFMIHEEYNPQRLLNDIALIKLPKKIELNRYVQPIGLPCGQNAEKTRFDNEWVTVSGWGEIATGQASDEMRFAYVMVEDEKKCKETFPTLVTDKQICSSGATAVGICLGDSGGPMAANDNGKTILIGISSFIHASGCNSAAPRAFARVSQFMDWIQAKTNLNACKA